MDLVNRSSLITERDLNREFFEAAHRTEEELSQSKYQDNDYKNEAKRGRGFKAWLKHIVKSPLCLCRVFNRNFSFCCHVVLPQIWQYFVRKWDRFSLFTSLKKTFPGVVLLFTAFQSLLSIRCRRPRCRKLQALDSNNNVDVLDIPAKVKEDEAGFSSTYPTKEIIKKSFFQDVFIGCSIGAMSVPQGMSYALLAGLDYEYGLYNGLVHPLMYFLFGTCRHAITGVSAIENLMLGERLNVLLGYTSTPSQRINAALGLSIMSAFMYFLFRLCRLSVIADLLADPVLSGFATASAFVIGASQLKHVFNLSGIQSEWGVIETVSYIIKHIHDCHVPSILCCVVAMVFLMLCKHLNKRYCKKFPIPGPMLLVIFGCLLSWSIGLSSRFGVKNVGNIPRGLPAFHVPSITWSTKDSPATLDAPAFSDLFWQCLTLCPLYFIIHISIAKTIAMRQKYFLDYGQELVAFSACNLVGGFLQCYPTCTSLSRSSVAESLGARTHFHGLAASLVVLCTLVFLTGPLGFLPMPALAAVVLFGVSKMAEFGVLRKLWRLQKTSWEATGDIGGGVSSPDLLLWIMAFATTIIFGASEGIIIAVAVSLIWVGRKLVRPEFVQLGRLAGTTIYRNKDRFPETEIDPGIILYRIDAPINFCNAGFLEREIRKAIVHHFPTDEEINLDMEMRSSTPCLLQKPKLGLTRSQDAHHQVAAPRFFILDCSSVDALDITAISALARIEAFAAGRQVMLIFANWKGPQRDFLYKADFYRIVPPNRCFLSNHDAVRWCRALQVSLRLTLEPSPVGSTRIGSTEIQDSWEMDSHPQQNRIIHFEDTWRAIEARELAGTLVDDHDRPQVEVEWDGLSALAPNIRIVQEVTKDGPRGWMVTVSDDEIARRNASSLTPQDSLGHPATTKD